VDLNGEILLVFKTPLITAAISIAVFNGSVLPENGLLDEQQGVVCQDSLLATRHSGVA
jgi:hypothetical protein